MSKSNPQGALFSKNAQDYGIFNSVTELLETGIIDSSKPIIAPKNITIVFFLLGTREHLIEKGGIYAGLAKAQEVGKRTDEGLEDSNIMRQRSTRKYTG